MSVCAKCKGSGLVWLGGKRVVCSVCQGRVAS